MKIATYNVNGINGRLPVLLRWLAEAAPDVVCLQELKAPQDKFPLTDIREAGYGAIWHGQKSWNGVAILSRGCDPVETRRGLPGDPGDLHSRYIEAAVQGVIVGCLYLPNGNPAPGPKFDYKLGWFERLSLHAASLLEQDVPVILAGDYNVMPTELDVYKPEKWVDDALFRPEVRGAFQDLLAQGWVDAVRSLHPGERIYTFWDYFRNAYGRDAGLRLDHLLLSPHLAGRLKMAAVDKEVRGWEHASDHAPAWIELAAADPIKKRAPARKSKEEPAKPTTRKKAKEKSGPTKQPKPRALTLYKSKRKFADTPEPAGKLAKKAGASFVIQEHHARRHHFDFRLEVDGVLVSWAVPKGIPEEASAKRLAIHVEDHPLDYASFEGEIPKGNYGAGTVKLWDKGEWEPQGRSWRRDFDKGKLKLFLRGTRLRGEYLLVRTEEPNWIMRKLSDSAPTELAGEMEREKARFVPFQLARVVPSVPAGSEWIHELKLDGYRIQAVKADGKLRIFTRNGHDWTDKFGTLAERLDALSRKDFVLDGEAVVFDGKGRTSFGLLQEALGVRARFRPGVEINFVAFDILHFDGVNLRPLALSERLKQLDTLPIGESGSIRRSKVWTATEGAELFREACRLELEGIISKKLSQPYAPDLREWTKSKCRPRQEFIVCGYLPPRSSLPAFSSLVLGTVENGKLVPRGNVGTGFTEEGRRELLRKLDKLRSDTPAFKIKDRNVVWVRPQLVAEIEYAEITRDGSVRQASFIALRADKGPKEVHLEGIQKARAEAKNAVVSGITISHPERVVFPGDGVTKFQVAGYFERVADLMLPFVANRPLALLRAPTGVGGELFFQKSFDKGTPRDVFCKVLDDGTETIFVKDAKGLVSLAQFGVLEFHPWGARYPGADKPDFLIWDLDPDSAVEWPEVMGAAFLLRDFLRARGLETMVKTSGGKGLHIQLPLKPAFGWDVLKEFTKQVSVAVAAFNPPKFTTVVSKSRRKGKIFIDYLRNGRGATCIAPWGLRARPKAPVSMPVSWDDLAGVTAAGFTIDEPPQTPAEWTNFKSQRLTKGHLKEFGLA